MKALSLMLVIVGSFGMAGAGQNFFPSGIFRPSDTKADSFVAKWYSEQLTGLDEPSCSKLRKICLSRVIAFYGSAVFTAQLLFAF